jgi:alkanesulfonate monooxygenase SsuD/methylene tetrahydromethanopterin reductase-like flavin-dependent oxidoreductase (luciferase family)
MAGELRTRLQVGLILNQDEAPGLETPRWKDVRAMAREAEAIGVDSIWLVDHFLWEGDPWLRDAQPVGGRSTERYGVWEAWTTLAALAEATDRVQLGTLVTCTGYRNPALLAKMADTVDEISGGRLILGLGAGDRLGEHEMFGFGHYDRRVSRFEEALQVIAPLLRTGHVDFAGEFYLARDCELKPRGPRAGGPPILIGAIAGAPRMLRLAAQHADIWNGWNVGHAHALPPLLAAVDSACAKVGRDSATLARTATVVVALDGPMTSLPGAITGSDAEIAAELDAFSARGIDGVQAFLFPTEGRSLERFGRVIEELRSASSR